MIAESLHCIGEFYHQECIEDVEDVAEALLTSILPVSQRMTTLVGPLVNLASSLLVLDEGAKLLFDKWKSDQLRKTDPTFPIREKSAALEKDGDDDPAPWSLYEQYMRSGNNDSDKHELSEMLGRWKTDKVRLLCFVTQAC